MSIANFNVEVFGKLKEYSPTLSLARVRIFYTGANRNATYITEEFANKLLSTLSYAPIKGIYQSEDGDFSDHGKFRTQGRVYGVVPENPNITWESHLDEDGVTRTYACADVLLFTGLYPEAAEIPGKAQSMEIYAKSIKGEWQVIDKKRVYVYTDGCFLGLQALGDKVEPCFEGSEFFSLYTNLKNLIDNLEGGKEMVLNFKLSDSTKHDMLFDAINPNYTPEGNWEISYGICDIYDEYALCYSYEQQGFCRAYYQKDDEKNTVTLGDVEKCFIVDVTEAEYAALNLLKTANGGNFEKVDEVYTVANSKIETLTSDLQTKTEEFDAKVVEYDTKVVEYDTKVTELETANASLAEKDTTIASLQETIGTIAEKDAQIESLTGELSTLKTYKSEVETTQKEEIVSRYTSILDEDTIKNFSDNLDKYTVVELEKELAFSAVQKNPNVFSKSQEPGGAFIPTGGTENFSGATKILMKHKKK